jgi:hypothetical protein
MPARASRPHRALTAVLAAITIVLTSIASLTAASPAQAKTAKTATPVAGNASLPAPTLLTPSAPYLSDATAPAAAAASTSATRSGTTTARSVDVDEPALRRDAALASIPADNAPRAVAQARGQRYQAITLRLLPDLTIDVALEMRTVSGRNASYGGTVFENGTPVGEGSFTLTDAADGTGAGALMRGRFRVGRAVWVVLPQFDGHHLVRQLTAAEMHPEPEDAAATESVTNATTAAAAATASTGVIASPAAAVTGTKPAGLNNPNQLDVLFLVTTDGLAAANSHGGVDGIVATFINSANNAARNTGLVFSFNAVDVEDVSVASTPGGAGANTDATDLTAGLWGSGRLSFVAALRNNAHADMVVMLGNGYGGGSTRAISDVHYSTERRAVATAMDVIWADPTELAHELGHQLGQHHDWTGEINDNATGGFNLDPTLADHAFGDPSIGQTTVDGGNGTSSSCPGCAVAEVWSRTAWNFPGTNHVAGTPDNVNEPADSYHSLNKWVPAFSHWDGSPFGALDNVEPTPTGLRLTGWATDPDSGNAFDQVAIFEDPGANQVSFGNFTEKVSRPDVAAAWPDFGAKHGFDITLQTAVGTHQWCVYAINRASTDGANDLIGCRTVTVGGNPIGSSDTLAAENGGVHVVGWALDPDTTASIPVATTIDGTTTTVTANQARGDIAAAFPDYGAAHGYDAHVYAAPGGHNVCVQAVNTAGAGANTTLGCAVVTVPAAPFGSFDSATVAPGGIHVRGWTIDPSTTSSAFADIYVDNAGIRLAATSARPDIAAAFPHYGAAHGFDAVIPAGVGNHNVCAYAIAVNGTPSTLRCVPVTIDGNAIGAVDAFSGVPGGIHVAGWAIDPDTAAATRIDVYIDNVGTPLIANAYRGDVGTAFPDYGSNHGVDVVLAAPPGPHTVCAYAINITGPGTNKTLSCQTLTAT